MGLISVSTQPLTKTASKILLPILRLLLHASISLFAEVLPCACKGDTDRLLWGKM